MKRKLFFSFIIIEAILILFLGISVYKKYSAVKNTSVSVIGSGSISFTGGALKHFYEPQANSNDIGFDSPEWLEYDPAYTINSDTLNDGTEYQIKKPENTYRIVTLGDSFTFGLYVDTSDNYSEQLEQLLNNESCENNFEIVNLGVMGYDIQYSLERYRTRGAKYDPDLVIWFVQQGNFSKIQELIQSRINAEYKTKDAKAAARAGEDILSEIGEKSIVDYQGSLLEKFGDSHRKKFIIYSFTDWLWGEQENHVRNLVENNPLGYSYKSPLDLQGNNALFPDYHPNQKGHLLMAQDLSSYLLKNNIIPCD